MCKKKKKKSHATDHKSQIQTPIDYTRSLTVRAPIGCWSHDHRRGFPRLFVFLGDLRQSSPIGAGESSGDMWWMSEGDVGMDGAHTGGMKRQQQQMRRRRRRRGGGAEGYCAKNTTAGFTTLQSTLCSPHGRFLNVYFLIYLFFDIRPVRFNWVLDGLGCFIGSTRRRCELMSSKISYQCHIYSCYKWWSLSFFYYSAKQNVINKF